MKKILSILLVLCMLCGCSQQSVDVPVETITPPVTEESPAPEETPAEAKLSIYEKNALYLVETIEATHPCFILDDVPDGYEEAKAEYLKAAKRVKNEEKFYEISSKYCVSLKDTHTGLYLNTSRDSIHILQVLWYFDGEKLYLCDENNVPLNVEVLKIGNLDVQKVFDTIDIYRALENENARKRAYRTLSRRDYILEYAGMKVDAEKPVTLTFSNGNTLDVKWKEEIIAGSSYSWQADNGTISYEMMGDIFYIDHNACSVNDPALESTCNTLREAIDAGIGKVIYDVRGNAGGNSNACEAIVRAMDMIAPSFGMVARISELFKQTYPERFNERNINRETWVNNANINSLANEDVELIVLSDETTASSALQLCVWIQDGKLGKVVGRGSGNKPNHYGNVRLFTLPNLGWQGQISTTQWTRPDASADPNQFQPDVEVPFGTDTLSVALELMAE